MSKNPRSGILNRWINKIYLHEKTIANLKNKFKKNDPYPYLELSGFFNENKAKGLLSALAKERFYEKNSDLFKFYQTNDIASSKNSELLDFRYFLASVDFIRYMEFLTGLNLKPGKIDLAGTLYKDTNFLLCHDDKLEKRKIAFLFYLSNLEDKDGGSLNLMDAHFKLTRKIRPEFNKFTFFQVSSHSFHEVQELVANKQRMAFGGWFHDK